MASDLRLLRISKLFVPTRSSTHSNFLDLSSNSYVYEVRCDVHRAATPIDNEVADEMEECCDASESAELDATLRAIQNEI